jgi:uncharacterized protein (DUF305 family)
MKTSRILAAAAVLSLGGGAWAQPAVNQGKMAPAVKGAGPNLAMADKAFLSGMQTMNKQMMAAKGATVDATFAGKMLAHHDGAIAMARTELEYGSNLPMRKMAQTIIDEQTRQAAQLRDWLRQHGG